jgi:hypothetical protein
VGVNNLTRPGARHPGEDYRCHCVAINLSHEEAAKLQNPPPREPQSTAELITNYENKFLKYSTPQQADKFIQMAYSGWVSLLSAQEASSLRAYKQTGYRKINNGLRDGEIFPPYSNEAKYVQGIDSAIAQGSVPDNLIVYRGVSDSFADEILRLQVNDEFSDLAYTSTSFSEKKAVASAKGKTVIVMKVPKGYNTVYMESLISNSVSGEYELLLKRNAKFKITKKYFKNDLNYIEVEAL